MPRKLDIDAIESEIASVNTLLKQAIEVGDPLGEYQFEKRIKALKEQLSTFTNKVDCTASVALFFGGGPVLGSRGISAEFAGNILENYQDIVSRTHAINELGPIGERGPIPLKQTANLMITEIARGSFGFILDEMSDQSECFDTVLKSTIEEVSSMLEKVASSSEDDFDEVMEKMDSRILIALKNFFVTLASHDATLRLVEDTSEFTLDENAVNRAKRRIETTSIEEVDDSITGVLEGFLPDHRKFELKLDSGNVIYGSVQKEAVDQYNKFLELGFMPIKCMWKLKIHQRIVKPLNRNPREVFRLIEFIEKMN